MIITSTFKMRKIKPQQDAVTKVMVDAQEQRHNNHVEASKKYYKALKNYQKAYNILMNYFDELTPESRAEIDKKLKKVGL